MTELGGIQRYSLWVGLVLSVLGVIAGMLGGLIYLTDGKLGYALLSWLVGAPYSLAMVAVFRHVLNRG